MRRAKTTPAPALPRCRVPGCSGELERDLEYPRPRWHCTSPYCPSKRKAERRIGGVLVL